MFKLITKLKTNDSGATAIEYGMIAGLISIVVITAAVSIGGDLGTLFDNLSTSVSTGAEGVGGGGGDDTTVN